METGERDIPTESHMRRLLGPHPSAQELDNLRDSVDLLRRILEDLPPPLDDVDPGHIFPVRLPK